MGLDDEEAGLLGGDQLEAVPGVANGEGSDDVEDLLADDLPDFNVEHHQRFEVADEPLASASVDDQKRKMWAACQPYAEASIDCDDPLLYWAEGGVGATSFQLVKYGARSLLKFLSGNAKLERVFSAAKLVFGDEKRKNCDLYRLLMLRFNGYPCLLPHYVEKWKSAC